MKKQARFNYANAYNAKEGLLQYRVSPFLPGETFAQNLIPLSQWCSTNFYSIKQGYGLIKKKQLLALKMGGVWYVRPNPYCSEYLLRNEPD